MADAVRTLLSLMAMALVPLTALAVVRLARRWPLTMLALLLLLIGAGAGTLAWAGHDGYSVDRTTRVMTYGSEAARWCFPAGWMLLAFGVPALPLVVIARARNGFAIGPVGVQWVFVLFGYWMACMVWGTALYSLLTGIIK